jgi:cold shock CspA family protein
MATGRISEVNNEKGYGFVQEDQTGKMIRFNTDDVPEGLKPDVRVKFNVIDLDPGNIAVNFLIIEVSENQDGFAA